RTHIMTKKIRKQGFGFNVDLTNINLLKTKDVVRLSVAELNVLLIACSLEEENILQALVNSKNKELCKKYAMDLNLVLNIQNKISQDILTRNLCENKTLTVNFTIEETEMLVRGLTIHLYKLKENFDSKSIGFNDSCKKVAMANELMCKIDIYSEEIIIEEIEEGAEV
ncbi:MAG: hypothetical protein ACRDB0_01685, partial [Paraclostridium sp.]